MEMRSLEDIGKLLSNAATAQFLFQKDVLLMKNTAAEKALPNIQVGMTAEQVFGEQSKDFQSFSGKGSLLFSLSRCGRNWDVKVTEWMEFRLVELTEPMDALSASALRSVAEGLAKPMTTVMALTPKLLPQLEETSDQKNMERAAQVNQGLYAIHRAINNIRFAAGGDGLKLYARRINITRWLEELTRQLSGMCEMAGKKLVTELPTRDFMCDMDGELLERAILNILSNAMKYTEPGDEIYLGLTKMGSRVRITLRDPGCGIPAYRMGTLFQQKEHREQVSDPRQGIGLGLQMARRIMQAHGGTLLLESEEGKGTGVHLMLPVSQGKENLSLSTTIQRPDYSGGFNKLLLELSDVLPSRAFDTRGIDL